MLVALSAHCLNKGTFDGAFLHDTWALAQIIFVWNETRACVDKSQTFSNSLDDECHFCFIWSM